MHGIDRTAAGIGCNRRKQSRLRDAEPRLLALHISTRLERGRVLIDAVKNRARLRFSPVCDGETCGKEECHTRENCPTMSGRSCHSAQSDGESKTDQKNQEHLDEVTEGCWVFKWMSTVCNEEPTTVRTEHLDRLLRSDRALGDDLGLMFKRLGCRIRVQVLHDTLAHKDQREDDANRQQDIKTGLRCIDPEIADRLR